MASSIDHPSLLILAKINAWLTPVSSDHAATVCVLPLTAISLLVLRFLACSFAVAHRQLSGLYGPSLSLRSSVRLGLYPELRDHSRKGIYSCHSSHTVIPRPA